MCRLDMPAVQRPAEAAAAMGRTISTVTAQRRHRLIACAGFAPLDTRMSQPDAGAATQRRGWYPPAESELADASVRDPVSRRSRPAVAVKPVLGDWEIPRVSLMRTAEARKFAELPVPGRQGSLFQDLNAEPTLVEIAGSLFADEERSEVPDDRPREVPRGVNRSPSSPTSPRPPTSSSS